MSSVNLKCKVENHAHLQKGRDNYCNDVKANK